MVVENQENTYEATGAEQVEDLNTEKAVKRRTRNSLKALNGIVDKTVKAMTKPFKKKEKEQPTQRAQVESPQDYDFDLVSKEEERTQIQDDFRTVIPEICNGNNKNLTIYKAWEDVYRFWTTFDTAKGNIECFFYIKKIQVGNSVQYLPLGTVKDIDFPGKLVRNPCYGEGLKIRDGDYSRYGDNAILKNDRVFDVPVFNGINYWKEFKNLTPQYNEVKTREHCMEVIRKKELQMEWIDDLAPNNIQLTPDEKKLLYYTVQGWLNQNYRNSNMQQINLKTRLENSLVLDKDVTVNWDTYSRTLIFKNNEGITTTAAKVEYEFNSDGKLVIKNDGQNLTGLSALWTPRMKEEWGKIKLFIDSTGVSNYQTAQIQEFSELYKTVKDAWITGNLKLTTKLYPYNSTEGANAVKPEAIDQNNNVKLSDCFYYAPDHKIYDTFGQTVSQAFIDGYGVKNENWRLSFIRINNENIKPYHLLTFNKDGRKWDVQPHYDWNWKLIIYDKKGNQISECKVTHKEQKSPKDNEGGYKYEESAAVKLEADDFYTELLKKVKVDNTLLTTEHIKTIFTTQFNGLPQKEKEIKGMKVKQEDGTMDIYTASASDDVVWLKKVPHDKIKELIDNLAKMSERINQIKNMEALVNNNWNVFPLSDDYAEAGMGMIFDIEMSESDFAKFPDGLKIKVKFSNNGSIENTVTLVYDWKDERWDFKLDVDKNTGKTYDRFKLWDTKYKLEFQDWPRPVLTFNTLSREDQNPRQK